MTTKELSYVEDACHETYFLTKCKETWNQIKDAELKGYVEQMAIEASAAFPELLRLALTKKGVNMDDKNLMENILIWRKA